MYGPCAFHRVVVDVVVYLKASVKRADTVEIYTIPSFSARIDVHGKLFGKTNPYFGQ